MNPAQKYVSFILQSPVFEQVDVPDLKKLSSEISLHRINHVIDVNQAMKEQLDIEVSISYLHGKYKALQNESDAAHGRRWSLLTIVGSNRDPTLKLDDEYLELLKTYRNYEALVFNLKSIVGIVFGRQQKLNELSWNYRRELATDSH